MSVKIFLSHSDMKLLTDGVREKKQRELVCLHECYTHTPVHDDVRPRQP